MMVLGGGEVPPTGSVGRAPAVCESPVRRNRSVTRLLLTRMARGIFLMFLAATGCRNSNAASQPENKPPPGGGQGPDVPGLPRDPGFKRTEVEQRRELLEMLDDKHVPLAKPEATMDQQMQAKTTF